jgi:protein-tyrosine-phosphatase
MAVGILEKILGQELLRSVELDSAGVDAQPGQGASSGALAATREHGIDISDHVSKRLTRALVQKADLILVMQRSHLDRVRELCPSRIEHVMLLAELGDPGKVEGTEIPDPHGGSAEVYRRCFAQIEESLRNGAQFLAELISAGRSS